MQSYKAAGAVTAVTSDVHTLAAAANTLATQAQTDTQTS